MVINVILKVNPVPLIPFLYSFVPILLSNGNLAMPAIMFKRVGLRALVTYTLHFLQSG
jgi:hypothetical protein